jgi:LPXTG-site transpeptidase (sortase) family protein
MTQTDTDAPVFAPARETAPATRTAPERPRAPRRAGQHPWVVGAAALGLAILFALGFFVYLFGLSGLSEARAQTAMFKNFVYQLQQATAPVQPYTTGANGAQTPLADGTPVAALNIPELGLNDVVVVEGTTSRDLALGPGHTASSALPGQSGVSFIYGKDAPNGAPFAHLMQLNRGDKFTVTTGQGTATYEVMSFGTSVKPAPADSSNRLVLETAAAGIWPSSAVQVSADLVSQPQLNPDNWPTVIPPEDSYMASDISDGIIPLMLWSQALLIAVIISTIATYRWSRWATYLVMAPVILALTWCVYQNLAVLLPNLY